MEINQDFKGSEMLWNKYGQCNCLGTLKNANCSATLRYGGNKKEIKLMPWEG